MTMIKESKDVRQYVRRSAIMLMLVAFALTGCGKSTDVTKSETTAIYVGKDGKVINTIVEDFSASYYNLDEMKAGIEEEVSEYNSTKGQDLITLQDTVKEDANVRVVMTYKDAASYADFNKMLFFYGSYKDIKAAGYSLPSTLVDSKGEKIDISKIAEDQMGVVMEEKIGFFSSGKIAYAPAGSVWNGSKNVDLSATQDDLCYIVLKAD